MRSQANALAASREAVAGHAPFDRSLSAVTVQDVHALVVDDDVVADAAAHLGLAQLGRWQQRSRIARCSWSPACLPPRDDNASGRQRLRLQPKPATCENARNRTSPGDCCRHPTTCCALVTFLNPPVSQTHNCSNGARSTPPPSRGWPRTVRWLSAHVEPGTPARPHARGCVGRERSACRRTTPQERRRDPPPRHSGARRPDRRARHGQSGEGAHVRSGVDPHASSQSLSPW